MFDLGNAFGGLLQGAAGGIGQALQNFPQQSQGNFVPQDFEQQSQGNFVPQPKNLQSQGNIFRQSQGNDYDPEGENVDPEQFGNLFAEMFKAGYVSMFD